MNQKNLSQLYQRWKLSLPNAQVIATKEEQEEYERKYVQAQHVATFLLANYTFFNAEYSHLKNWRLN